MVGVWREQTCQVKITVVVLLCTYLSIRAKMGERGYWHGFYRDITIDQMFIIFTAPSSEDCFY